MLSNVELIQSLDDLEVAFQNAASPRASTMFAKHALLELCGWIEEAEDQLIQQCSNKLVNASLKKLVADKIRCNYSFHFTDSFIPLISLVIGLQKYESIKAKLAISGIHFTSLASTIDNLKDPRNKHAHTHFEAGKPQINGLLNGQSPLSLKQTAVSIYMGFSELEKCLKKHRLL